MTQHHQDPNDDAGAPRAERVGDAHDAPQSDRSSEQQAVINEEDALASGEENPS